MNILFVTIIKINSINDRGVYPDLLRKFLHEGHKIYIVTPLERRYRQKSTIERQDNLVTLKIKTLNYQKTNIIEKWIGTLLINYLYLKKIKRYFSNIKFDLVLYSTPPITFNGLIEHIKKRDGARSYLLLKDIFPQNAVNLGLIREGGCIYNYYKRKEKLLYKVSDHIGCMSQANVDYILKNNPQLQNSKVEINPNSHELFDEQITPENKVFIKMKYNIPLSKVICIYGGNLGKPQGVQFIIEFLNSQTNNEDVFFLIVGSGTEYGRL